MADNNYFCRRCSVLLISAIHELICHKGELETSLQNAMIQLHYLEGLALEKKRFAD